MLVKIQVFWDMMLCWLDWHCIVPQKTWICISTTENTSHLATDVTWYHY